MNQTEYVIATAIILLLAFAMGWLAHIAVARLSRAAGKDLSEMDQLAQSLHEAEEARDEAILQLETRESELLSQLHQGEAELRAAMEGLRDARQEVEEMRSYIAKMHENS